MIYYYGYDELVCVIDDTDDDIKYTTYNVPRISLLMT